MLKDVQLAWIKTKNALAAPPWFKQTWKNIGPPLPHLQTEDSSLKGKKKDP